ncbi:hypothetical protein C8T65DRAFT_744955 [Cerioporus squamosus]|nr:hypothetical protein C8T65DRAFT_744955 [Cerioporus squamosus]
MSSSSSAYVHEIAVVTKETYCVLSAFALLSFEWVITLDREARLVWGQKATVATILFVLNRYWLFLEYITQVITIYPLSNLSFQGCDAVGYMVIIGNAGPPYIWALFSTLRAYALSRRKWWVIPLTSVWFIPHLVMESLYYSHLRPLEAPSPLNCVLSSTFPETEWIHLLYRTIASRTCAIVGDLVVLVITWHSTYGIRKATAGLQVRTSLTDALLKDGTLYFVCLLVLNLLNIFVNAFPRTSDVTAFQDPITSILISRFILNLRDVADWKSDDLTEPSFVRHSRTRVTSTVNFADFIDPMGGDLDHGASGRSSPDGDCSQGPEESEMESFAATRTYAGSGTGKSVENAAANA